MSQHDFTIGNQLFPDTRTDLNNALVALASNSSGSAEPSTTYANQWWYETDTNTLKIRNEANSAWISVAVLDQTSNNVLSINTQGLTISNLTLSSTLVTATGAELNKLSGTSVTSTELDKLSGTSVTSTELDKLSGTSVTSGELDILSGATVTTAELNKLSGANVTTAELNKLSGTNVTTAELDKLSAMTSSTTELNQLDDITRGSIIYGDSVGTARLAKGTDGQVLTATATDINWETPSVSDPAAITSSGGASPTPSLATGITAAEIRTLIGAGVSSSDTVYTHPNHTGEVTSSGDGATVISDNVVDEANLKVSNAPTDGYVLTAQSGNTGGLTWAEGGGDLIQDTTPQLGGNLDGNGKNILLGFDPNPDFDINASGSETSADSLDYLKIASGIDNDEFDELLGVEAPWTDTTIKHHYKIIKGSSTGALRAGAGLSSDFGDLVVFGNVHSDGTNSNITTGMTIDGGHLRLIAQGEADHSTTGYASFTIDAADVVVTGTVDGRDIATNIPASLGSAGQVLTVNSGATAAEWADAGASTTAGAVGTYAYLTRPDGNSVAVGSSHAGSGLRFSSVASTNDWNYNTANSVTTTTATGTWKAMGGSGAFAGTSHTIGTVFLRIS